MVLALFGAMRQPFVCGICGEHLRLILKYDKTQNTPARTPHCKQHEGRQRENKRQKGSSESTWFRI